MKQLIPVILSGGSGSRLWPLSRFFCPKQFIALASEVSLFHKTLLRLNNLPTASSSPIVVCNQEHRFLVAEQLRKAEVKKSTIILEPVGRNTAPAIAAAAMEAKSYQVDAILLVLPADHVILDEEGFSDAVNKALPLAQKGKLITFGVTPSAPETGFGYIKAVNKQGVSAVEIFVEKPNVEQAAKYVASGDYYWNSGIFMFRADRYLNEVKKSAPNIFEAVNNSYQRAVRDNDFIRLDSDAFTLAPSDSIDYAIMENTDAAMVVPLNVGWSDVGSWYLLWKASEKNELGNVLHGEVVVHNVKNSYVRAEHRLVAVAGVENHIIVETADAVLVAHVDHAQEIKQLVEQLKVTRR